MERVNLELIISLVIIMSTILGTTIPLYIQSNNQIEKTRDQIEVLRESSSHQIAAIHQEIAAIRDDMRDFHVRLEKQDAEFRGIMAKQDAEYKAGMLLLEEKFRRSNIN